VVLSESRQRVLRVKTVVRKCIYWLKNLLYFLWSYRHCFLESFVIARVDWIRRVYFWELARKLREHGGFAEIWRLFSIIDSSDSVNTSNHKALQKTMTVRPQEIEEIFESVDAFPDYRFDTEDPLSTFREHHLSI
jgi:hypothetical protein